MLKTVYQLFTQELLLIQRDKKIIFHSLGFFLVIIFGLHLSFSSQPNLLHNLTPGIVWVSIFLASLLGLENFLRLDLEDAALDQLLLSPFSLTGLLTLKICVFWLATVLPLICLLPVLLPILHLSWPEMLTLLSSLLLATPAFICIGATCKTLTLHLPQQGALLGLLLLPLCVPILLIGIDTFSQLNLHNGIMGNLAFLAGISLICFCTLPFAISHLLHWI